MSARLLPFILIPAVLIACGSNARLPTSDIVGAIPWQGDESLSYRLENGRGELIGRATLTVDVRNGRTALSQQFRSDAGSDETSVVVDSRTLKPASARREIVSPDETEVLEVSYTEDGALIKQGERQSGLAVPEHAYDNDTSLFLWRTLPFAAGYEARYVTIITNRRSRDTVTLRVTGRESVSIPAGTFDAWRLEISASNARQIAWYADTASRPLLKYDNDRGTIFALERMP